MPIDPAGLEGRLAWIAEFELLEASLAVIRVQANWRRLARSDDRWVEERRESEVLTFRPTDRSSHELHPLDLVVETGEGCSNRLVLIGVTVSLAGQPELEDARFEIDAWLEHAGSDGELTTRRSRLTLGQGELSELSFDSLRWPLPDPRDYELVVDMLPQIQVLAPRDGNIQVALDVARWSDLVAAGEPRSGGGGRGGRKSFLIEDGETIRMELPPYHPGKSWRGIEVTTTVERGGSAPTKELLGSYAVEIDAGTFLQSHADALVLTIRRIDTD